MEKGLQSKKLKPLKFSSIFLRCIHSHSRGRGQVITIHILCKVKTDIVNWQALSHGLSQQGVWVPFRTPQPLKRTHQDTQILGGGIYKNLNVKLIIEFFHLFLIPMTLFNDIMPYFDVQMYTCLWLKYEYIVIPLKNLDAPKFYKVLPILGTQFLNPG